MSFWSEKEEKSLQSRLCCDPTDHSWSVLISLSQPEVSRTSAVEVKSASADEQPFYDCFKTLIAT